MVRLTMPRAPRIATGRAALGFLLAALAVHCGGLTADAQPPVGRGPARDSASDLVDTIDQHFGRRWQAEQIQPAEPADDAEFLRRVYLDLSGRIPRVADVREFLADPAPDKRARLVEQRLATPDYVRHFTHVWRDLLLSHSSADHKFLAPPLEAWLARQLRDNRPHDEFVRAILTADLTQPGAVTFFTAHELKPENLAAATSRLFLGVNLECAQCHNHPFAPWKQEQFWELAAAFAGVRPLRADNPYLPGPEVMEVREIAVPGTNRRVHFRFLDGSQPGGDPAVPARAQLARWLTAAENPYFARAAVNRTWAHFFGRGLVDPLDALANHTATANGELLDALARQFAAQRFDARLLMRAIANSHTYQLSSRQSAASQRDSSAFARMAVRGLSGEQALASLAIATGLGSATAPAGGPAADLAGTVGGSATPDRSADAETTILAALALMNGRYVADATSVAGSHLLTAVTDGPFLEENARVETLFLATVSRFPTADEARQVRAFVDRQPDRCSGLADVLWALLNSSEFMTNH